MAVKLYVRGQVLYSLFGSVLSAASGETAVEVVKELLSLQDTEPSVELLSRIETLPVRIRSSLERFGLSRRVGVSIAELYERFLKFKCYKNVLSLAFFAA